MRELLDHLPPLVKIVSVDGSPALAWETSGTGPDSGTGRETVASAASAAAVPNPLQWDSSESSEAASTESEGSPEPQGEMDLDETIVFTEQPHADDVQDSSASPFSVVDDNGDPTARTRRRTPSGGGLRTALGVVAGGLLAIPIAGAILWAFGLGPFEKKSTSSAVVTNRPVDLAREARNASSPVASQPTAPSTWGLSETSEVAAENQDLPAAVDRLDGTDLADRQAELDPPSLTAGPTAESANASLPDRDLPVVEERLESDALVAAVELAERMIAALEKTQDLDPRKRESYIAKTYETIAEASGMAQHSGPSIRRLAGVIKASSLLDEFKQAGADWTGARDRGNDGVLLIGQSDGSSLQPVSGRSIAIRGDVELPSSGETMVLGRIIDSETLSAIWVEPLP